MIWPTIDFTTSQVVRYGGEDPRNRNILHALAYCQVCGDSGDLSLIGELFYCFYHRS